MEIAERVYIKSDVGQEIYEGDNVIIEIKDSTIRGKIHKIEAGYDAIKVEVDFLNDDSYIEIASYEVSNITKVTW